MASTRIDVFVKKEELPEYFRQLADALERGGSGEFDCADDFRKLKITARDEYGQVSLRFKYKTHADCRSEDEDLQPDPGAAPIKPRYKDLKKRMGISFKILFKMIHQGQVPPQEAVDSFLADSKLMVEYPGYGDPYYDEYIRACDAFAEAYAVGDLDALNRAVDTLVHQKGHCHAKYK